MKGRWTTYTVEQLAWIEANSAMPRRDLHAAFCAQFGRADVSQGNITALCKRKGWLTGRTGRFDRGITPHNKGKPFSPKGSEKGRFKTGGLPHNTKYLGHERVSKDGYVEISVAETNPHTGFARRYVLKHVHLWEKANGRIPEGHCLKCLSADKTNTDPSNWELVPRALLPRLNGRFGRGYDAAPAELKPTILTVTKLEHASRAKKGGVA